MAESPDTGKQTVASYLKLMHDGHQKLIASLDGISDGQLWAKPTPDAWSTGENLDHLRVIYHSWMGIIKGFWTIFQSFARFRRSRPYPVEIDNVYRRPGFPQKVGWMWPPRYTPQKPAPLQTLLSNIQQEHALVEQFYSTKEADLLGHVIMYDPAIGKMNLIQGLRVALYHDEMHYEQIEVTLKQVGGLSDDWSIVGGKRVKSSKINTPQRIKQD